MTLLVPLADYKTAIGETNAANDTLHTESIKAASAAVLNYTDRDFGSAVVTETRDYYYDGSGVLNIDDAAEVHTVSRSGWTPRTEGPYGAQGVYTWVALPKVLSVSGEMGFTQNLDVLIEEGTVPDLPVSVNADFGWPTVPDDVKRATIWIAKSFEDEDAGGAGALSSESVAEVTRSWVTAPQVTQDAISRRATSLLEPYRRRIL